MTLNPAQHPLPSGYGPHTTTREVIGDLRLDGTLAIVTGGYAGVGLETTRTLHAAGATVVVPARTPEKARQALGGLARVELERLDLGARTRSTPSRRASWRRTARSGSCSTRVGFDQWVKDPNDRSLTFHLRAARRQLEAVVGGARSRSKAQPRRG